MGEVFIGFYIMLQGAERMVVAWHVALAVLFFGSVALLEPVSDRRVGAALPPSAEFCACVRVRG
jgi:hypothetical protein